MSGSSSRSSRLAISFHSLPPQFWYQCVNLRVRVIRTFLSGSALPLKMIVKAEKVCPQWDNTHRHATGVNSERPYRDSQCRIPCHFIPQNSYIALRGLARVTSSHGSSWHDRRLCMVHVKLLFWGSVFSIEAAPAEAPQGTRPCCPSHTFSSPPAIAL